MVWVLLNTDLNLTRNFSKGDEFKIVKESELRKSRTLSTYWFLFKSTTQWPLSAFATIKSLSLTFLQIEDKLLISSEVFRVC